MVQEIYIIDNKEELIENLKNIFKNKEEEFIFKSVKTEDLMVALRNIPAMIIINEDNIDMTINELCSKIVSDENNSITPIAVVSLVVNHGFQLMAIMRYYSTLEV